MILLQNLAGLCHKIAWHQDFFNAPETLGCVAGARCGLASIGAIQDALNSNLPAVGYSVTYAVAHLALVFSSLLALAFV